MLQVAQLRGAAWIQPQVHFYCKASGNGWSPERLKPHWKIGSQLDPERSWNPGNFLWRKRLGMACGFGGVVSTRVPKITLAGRTKLRMLHEWKNNQHDASDRAAQIHGFAKSVICCFYYTGHVPKTNQKTQQFLPRRSACMANPTSSAARFLVSLVSSEDAELPWTAHTLDKNRKTPSSLTRQTTVYRLVVSIKAPENADLLKDPPKNTYSITYHPL